MGNGIAREDLVLYSELTRQAFVESVPANKSTNNTASPAVITSSADTQTIYGACLVSNSTKNNIASGVLLSAAKYSVARSLPTTGDALGIKYSLSLGNAA
jgi:predicted hotdog family 3-hydroxylacyl-ACP dehydratase